MRAHSFKDAKAKKQLDKFSVGDFVYPNLMAADILLYSPEIVPVGKDQKQHLEFARDYAQKFNKIFGKTFKLPKPLILKSVSVVIGNDGRKMSKSYKNHLPLFASEKETAEYIRTFPMDSKKPEDKKNPDDYDLYKLFKLFANEKEDSEMRRLFENGGVGYGDIKKIIVKKINDFLRPMRKKRKELEKKQEKIIKILEKGGKKARKEAMVKMLEVRKKVGFEIYK